MQRTIFADVPSVFLWGEQDMHPTWDPPANAEAIDRIFAIYDDEGIASGTYTPQESSAEPVEEVNAEEKPNS